MKQHRLQQQISFIIEIDKMKDILRRTNLINDKRKENDAEHSWHIAIMAALLFEYADAEVDILKVIKMLLIHDLVEIYAGDTYAYDEEGYKYKAKREASAAKRIYSLLPENQALELRSLWEEFEEHKGPESRFAAALDVLQPLLLNYETEGISWKHHSVQSSMVRERTRLIKDGSSSLWEFATNLIEDAVKRGYLAE
ncbi:MAG TPA: HD domain-containing protein [Spirochaetota bacterium]|nr:HD domain-containing protein [Spirochaetota bacterium]